MDEVVYRCPVKATNKEGDRLRWSINWAFARRGELRLTTTAIECGDWTIPYDKIDDAVLLCVPFKFGNASTLHIKSMGRTYQFQLRSISAWLGSLIRSGSARLLFRCDGRSGESTPRALDRGLLVLAARGDPDGDLDHSQVSR